jgi:TatD DNase family protein
MHRIIDTHAHLNDPCFDIDLHEVIERAKNANIAAIIAVSEDLPGARKNIELAETYPVIRPCTGLYPSHLDIQQLEELLSFIRCEREILIAIGEVGLDYWAVKDEKGREIQREIFCSFIKLSLELDLPLNVHSRSAGHYAVDLLLKSGAKRVQLHAFDGKASFALAAVEAGYYFSIPPSIVRSQQKQNLVKRLPLQSLLIESDSPVLGPLPDERNEPGNVITAINAIAEIKGVHRDEVVETLYHNTFRLYGDIFRPLQN